MVDGVALGGAAQGFQAGMERLRKEDELELQKRLGQQRHELGQRGLDIQEQRLGLMARKDEREAQNTLTTRANSVVGDLLKTADGIITEGRKNGADMGKIRNAIAPLMKEINDLAPSIGRDPKQLAAMLEARMSAPMPEGDANGKTLDSTAASRLTALQSSLKLLPKLAEDINTFGEIGSAKNAAAIAQWPLGVGQPYQAWIRGTAAIESVLRTLTGAQAPFQEYKRLAKVFMPTPFDRLSTRKMKLNLLKDFIANGVATFQKGRQQVISPAEAQSILGDFERKLQNELGDEAQPKAEVMKAPSGDDILAKAKEALAQGADPQQIAKILEKQGLDPANVINPEEEQYIQDGGF